MRRLFLLAALPLAAGAAALAADATVLKLADFKVTPTNAGTDASLYGYNEGEGKLFLYVNGTAAAEFEAKEDGEVKVVIEASGDMGEKDRAKFKLTVGGTVIEKEFELKQNEAKAYTFKADVKKGKRKIEIEFVNDHYKENVYDCNLYIHSVKIEK